MLKLHMTTKRFIIAFSLLLILVGLFFFDKYRSSTMDRLYAEAAGYPGFFASSSQSVSAVHDLADYRGPYSTDLLLALASQDSPLVPEVQLEAIGALKTRHEPRLVPILTGLLQPHEDLSSRQAAADALESLQCKGNCVYPILHYLERVWRGELNDEDRWIFPEGSNRTNSKTKSAQKELYASLDGLLQREREETVTVLVRVYGLESSAPSPFALTTVTRLGLSEACPMLLKAREQLKDLSPENYQAPREELQSAIEGLKCR